MAYELLDIGGSMYALIFGVVSAIIMCFLDDRRTTCEPAVVGIVFVLVVFALLTFFFTNIYRYLLDEPLNTSISFLSIYIICGVAWIPLRWAFMVADIKRTLRMRQEEFFKENKIARLTANDAIRFKQAVIDVDTVYSGVDFNTTSLRFTPPQYEKNKQRMLIAACFWPWDLMLTIYTQPLTWFTVALFNKLGILAQAWSDRIFRNMDHDED